MTVPEPDTHDPLCPWKPWYDGNPEPIGYVNCECDFIAKVRADERGVGEPLDAEAVINVWASESHGVAEMPDGAVITYRHELIDLIQRARSAAPEPLTLAELEALPEWSVVTAGLYAWQKNGRGQWLKASLTGEELHSHELITIGPVHLLHRGQSD